MKQISENIRTIDETVKAAGVRDKQNEESVESEVLIEGDSVTDDANVGTIDEDVKADVITDKQNE